MVLRKGYDARPSAKQIQKAAIEDDATTITKNESVSTINYCDYNLMLCLQYIFVYINYSAINNYLFCINQILLSI